MWKAVMTLIALILVLIVVRPPENVRSACQTPMDAEPYPAEHLRAFNNAFVAVSSGGGKVRKVGLYQ
jgi:hypothetical protein